MSVLGDPALQARIDALQARSAAQDADMMAYFAKRAEKGDLSWDGLFGVVQEQPRGLPRFLA